MAIFESRPIGALAIGDRASYTRVLRAAINQHGQCVLNGVAEVLAPPEQTAWTPPAGLLPDDQP